MPLHAARLEIAFEGKPLVIESPQPPDFAAAVAALRV
jgi:hypothetical protein